MDAIRKSPSDMMIVSCPAGFSIVSLFIFDHELSVCTHVGVILVMSSMVRVPQVYSHHTHLPYKVKKQYVQILNIVDTSIKHQISGQSIPTVKGCMDVMIDE